MSKRQRPAGRALFDVLDSDGPGLPQSERSFRIMYTAPSNYDATLKLIRNIIIVDVNTDLYTQPKFKYARNVYEMCIRDRYTHQFGKKHVATLGVVFSPGHDLSNDAYEVTEVYKRQSYTCLMTG